MQPNEKSMTALGQAIRAALGNESGRVVPFGSDGSSEHALRVAMRNLIPSAFPGDDSVDIEALLNGLGVTLEGGVERGFGLTFPGRSHAVAMLRAPLPFALEPDPSSWVDWENTRNVVVSADNLVALRLMEKAYAGQARLIYVDPPYNTGNKFTYPDDFTDPMGAYLASTGHLDDTGRIQKIVDRHEALSGRKHSSWLAFMYPRLALAKTLLKDDGTILVSIDDNEVAHLRMLMDEIFGPDNFVGCFVWQGGRKNDVSFVSVGHDYILCYSRDRNLMSDRGTEWTTRKLGLKEIYAQAAKVVRDHGPDWLAATNAMKRWYRDLPHDHPSKAHAHYCNLDHRSDRGHLYFAGDLSKPGNGKFYDLHHPVTGKPVSTPSRGWLLTENRMAEFVADERIHFGASDDQSANLKRYLRETEEQVMSSVFEQDRRAAGKRLTELMEGKVFDFPKDESVLRNFIEAITSKDELVVDFFAGSGTTAHAVMLQNAADGGTRPFLIVQSPQKLSPHVVAPSAPDGGFTEISQITMERVRRAGRQVVEQAGKDHIDTGFRVFRQRPHAKPEWPSNISGEGDLLAALDAITPLVGIDPSEDLATVWREAMLRGFSFTSEVTADLGVERLYVVADTDGKVMTVYLGEKAAEIEEHVRTCMAVAKGMRKAWLLCRDAALTDTAIANMSLCCRLETF